MQACTKCGIIESQGNRWLCLLKWFISVKSKEMLCIFESIEYKKKMLRYLKCLLKRGNLNKGTKATDLLKVLSYTFTNIWIKNKN